MPREITGLNSLNSTPTAFSSKANIFSARVRHAMVDDKTESQVFKDFGEWGSIGCLFFDKLNLIVPNFQMMFVLSC